MKNWKIFFLILICVVSFGLVLVTTSSIDSYKLHLNNPESRDMLERIRSNFSKIHPEFGKIPLSADTSAYTEDKKRIAICLKDPKTGIPYSENTLMYVSLHELAHMINRDNYGHTDTFKKVFFSLLKKAQSFGFYNPKEKLPDTYCGQK
jgi:hypothetical protein